MTTPPDITFAFGAPDKVQVACMIAKKRYLQKQKLVVWSRNTSLLKRFDEQLWQMDSASFIPHQWLGTPRDNDCPIIISSTDDELPHYQQLLNLDQHWPPMYARFQHLIEVVTDEESDKEQARARWRFYKAAGHALIKHDLTIKPTSSSAQETSS